MKMAAPHERKYPPEKGGKFVKSSPFLCLLTGHDLGNPQAEVLAQQGMLKTFSSSMDHAICQWPSSTANVRCCGDLGWIQFEEFVGFFTGSSRQFGTGYVVNIQQSEGATKR